jgi:hypothetical protein
VLFALAPVAASRADAYTEAVALFEAMNARARYDEVISQIRRQPALGAQLDPALEDELKNRVFSEMVRIYAEVYTEEELVAIRAFFESPAGKAYLAKSPELSAKYIEVVTTIVTEVIQ